MDYKWSKRTLSKESMITKCGPCSLNCNPAGNTQKVEKYNIESTEQLLTLMSVYQSEWSHYDSIVWKHAFAYFGFIFAIIVFPFACPWKTALNILRMITIPWVFPITGGILAFILLIVMWRYAVRMNCCGKKYRDLIEKLPTDYQEERLNKNTNFPFRLSITVGVGIIMFVVLVAVAVFTMVHIPKLVEFLATNAI